MLTKRKEAVLKAIVNGYIDTVSPVGSQIIAGSQGLSVSPATIRMEMAGLEEDGYITRPHTSAGGIPTDKGYRHYVERLAERRDLAPREKENIQRQLRRAYLDQEELARLAATALPKLTGSLALITAPKATQLRLKRLDLIPVQELLVMLLLILQGTKIIRHLVSLPEPVSQQELIRMGNKLSDVFEGVTSAELDVTYTELTPLEEEIVDLARDLMKAEERLSYEELFFDGLSELFDQPEFSEAEILRAVLEILERRGYLRSIVEEVYTGPGVQVSIGGELQETSMRHFSLVIAEYGVAGHVTGVVGVLGPKRMDYGRNISAVQFLSNLMSQVVGEVYQ